MRFGLFGLGFAFFVIFMVLISTSNIGEERIDTIFENLDSNFSDNNYSNDANLSKFVKYTISGILDEFHGTYYFAAWIGPQLPRWLVDNKELLTVVVILALASPIIAVVVKFGLLIVLALFMFVWEQIKKTRRFKDGKEEG